MNHNFKLPEYRPPVVLPDSGKFVITLRGGRLWLHDRAPDQPQYPTFLDWWQTVGRNDPSTWDAWGRVSGPDSRTNYELLPDEIWETLPEDERTCIESWIGTLDISFFD